MNLKDKLYKEYLWFKEEIYPEIEFPEDWSWQWRRWCMGNCPNVGSCKWDKDKCWVKDKLKSMTVVNEQ